MGENGARRAGHRFLIHRRGDHVGVATSNIEAGERVIGIFMDDDSSITIESRASIPLGHKIAIESRDAEGEVLEYGVRIGLASENLRVGDYVHTHNIRSARW